MSTVLITGCSSGFGLAIAETFLARGWRVVATMRRPDPALFAPSDAIRILPLDVTDPVSIKGCVDQAGPLDALVNNAGVGLLNALEGVTMVQVLEVFSTNTLGLIATTQAVLPQMRERRAGVVVNVSSSVTLRPLELLSVYTASKAAVNAFTESLALELEPFGVRARLVLPGRAPATAFGANARARMGVNIPPAYALMAAQVFARLQASDEPVTESADVVEAVWRAVTEADAPMRQPAGSDAVQWASAA